MRGGGDRSTGEGGALAKNKKGRKRKRDKKKGAHAGCADSRENNLIGLLVAGSSGFRVRARATAAPLLLAGEGVAWR
jgi:hypothetical protein